NGAGLIIKRSPALDTELFGHRDLHTPDVIAVPERLDKRVREAKDQQVIYRSLAQIVVNAKDISFVEGAKQNLVQLPCGFKITSERLFDDDARPFGAT